MNEDDWNMLHYAVGILEGLAIKHGPLDVNIYYNSVRVRLDRVSKQEKEDTKHVD